MPLQQTRQNGSGLLSPYCSYLFNQDGWQLLLKDWENWLPMPCRISTEFEAILCSSLKYKEPDFSNHFKTSGGSLPCCLLISLKIKAISVACTRVYRKFPYFRTFGTQIPLNIFLRYTFISDKRSMCMLHIMWAFVPVTATAWKTSDLLVLQVWPPLKIFLSKALLTFIKYTVA